MSWNSFSTFWNHSGALDGGMTLDMSVDGAIVACAAALLFDSIRGRFVIGKSSPNDVGSLSLGLLFDNGICAVEGPMTCEADSACEFDDAEVEAVSKGMVEGHDDVFGLSSKVLVIDGLLSASEAELEDTSRGESMVDPAFGEREH